MRNEEFGPRRTAEAFQCKDGALAPQVQIVGGGQRFRLGALADVPLRDVQAAVHRAGPRTTTIYDRQKENFGRRAACVVAAFAAGG